METFPLKEYNPYDLYTYTYNFLYRSDYNTISGYITGSHFDGDLSQLTNSSANYITV